MQGSGKKILPYIVGLSLVMLIPVGLGGCGFRPLYGSQEAGGEGVSYQLKRVFVANIPSRFGQTMRLALQQDMAGSGPERPDGYILRANASISYEAIDIHQDNTSGRLRVVGWANWSLYSVEQNPRLLAQGYARTLDGYDPTINEYFAQTLNNKVVQTRVSQNLAHEITQQVAIWFRTQQAPGVDKHLKSEQYLDVDSMPADYGVAKQHLGVDGFPASVIGRKPAGLNTTTGTSDIDILDGEDNGDVNPSGVRRED